jgi:hypothetical protein
MRSRKVFRIYAALSLGEREAFGLYLASPYHNTSQRLVDFRQLLEEGLLQQPQQLSTEEVWRLLPGVTTEYRANGFDKLCAELLAALNDFLALQNFRSHAATVASHQLEAYVDRHLDEWVPGVFEGLVEKLGKDLERDAEGLYADLEITRIFGIQQFRVNRLPPGEQLLKIDQKLNAYYFARKLELASALDSYNQVFKAGLELSYNHFLKEVFEKDASEFPLLVQMHAIAWLLTQYRKKEFYFQLRELLKLHSGKIPEFEVHTLNRIALNYCVFQTNLEETEFEAETDEMYLRLLDNGGLLMEGKLGPATFKNIVQLRLRLGFENWTEKFIQDWGRQLVDDHSGYALIYNQAVLDFYKGEYGRCLKELENVLRDAKGDLHYGVDARVYSLMAVYELNKVEDWAMEFESRLNAFRVYLIRENKLDDIRKERYQNLIKQFRMLMNLKNELPKLRKRKAEKFLQTLAQLKPVPNRKWFELQVSILRA